MGTEKLRKLLKEELPKLMDELNRKQLIGLQVLLNSYRSTSGWGDLPKEAKASILRGKEDVKAGRYSDAFEYLKREG